MARVMRCTSHSATSTSSVASSLVAVAALKPMVRCSHSPNCVIARGAIAAVAVTFANYALALAGLPQRLTVPLAVGAIVLVSGINYVGVRPAAVTQNVFTVLKLVALAALIAAGLFAAPSTALYRPLPPSTAPAGGWEVGVAVGAALVPILFTYGGWQQTNFIAEEVIDAERNLTRALVTGVAGVVVVYA